MNSNFEVFKNTPEGRAAQQKAQEAQMLADTESGNTHKLHQLVSFLTRKISRIVNPLGITESKLPNGKFIKRDSLIDGGVARNEKPADHTPPKVNGLRH